MARIIIGRGYKEEFESIVEIANGGYLDDGIVVSATDRRIVTSANEFVLDLSVSGVNSGEQSSHKVGFAENGASWFDGFRGGQVDSSAADWTQLIMDVAANYHKNFSLIEFEQHGDKESEEEEIKLVERFNNKFLKNVFGSVANGFVLSRSDADFEDIYGVSLKMELSSGTGESKPALAKVFFRGSLASGLEPMKVADAVRVNKYLATAMPMSGGKQGKSHDIVSRAFADRVLRSVGDLTKKDNFVDFVSLGERDEKEIRRMLAGLAKTGESKGVKRLVCTRLKVLGISHVKWSSSAYRIHLAGNPVLKVSVGLGGTLSLFCLGCGKETPIMVNNKVLCPSKSMEKDLKLVIDSKEEDFGVTQREALELRKHSEFKNHLLTIKCEDNMRNPRCMRVVCASGLVSVKNGGKVVRKCKNCIYPEVVFSDIFGSGETGFTRSLTYAADKHTLVSGEVKTCKCCGRQFSANNVMRDGLCSFCAGTIATSGAPNADDKALYRHYCGVLSPAVRFAHLFDKKFCREDENVVLFILGKDKYVFDKLCITEFGYIKKPIKYKG